MKKETRKMEESLVITFQDTEQKVLFMDWFKRTGFDDFLKSPEGKTVNLEQIADFGYGTTPDVQVWNIESGYIELE